MRIDPDDEKGLKKQEDQLRKEEELKAIMKKLGSPTRPRYKRKMNGNATVNV